MSWRGAVAAVIALALLFAAEQAYEAHIESKADAAGYARAKGENDRMEAAIKADAERAVAQAVASAQAETAALQLKFDQLAESQQKDRVEYEVAKSIAVAAALAGGERLSISVAPAAAGGTLPQSGEIEGAAAGTGAEPATRADLLPSAAAAVLRFAGDYGQLVRDYNGLLGRFDAARASCNAD